MIQVHFDENDELIVVGEVQAGDVYHGLCCPGFDFTIATVIVDAWGHCGNLEHRCSNHGKDERCAYCGVNSFDVEDIIALFLYNRDGETVCPECNGKARFPTRTMIRKSGGKAGM